MQIVAAEGLEKRNSGVVEDFHVDANRPKVTGEAGVDDRNGSSSLGDPQGYDHLLRTEKTKIFVVKSMSQEMLLKHPNLEVCHTFKFIRTCG